MVDELKPSPEQIASALRQVVAQIDAARDAGGGDFYPDSPAVRDWTANEMPGDWGPQLLQDAYRTAELYGASVRDHVLALADLIERDRPLAVASIARTLAEPASRAVWLLEPNLEPIERVRRLLNDILFAAFEHETLWADEPRIAGNADIYSKIKKEATARGLVYSDPVREPSKRKFAAARLGEPRPLGQWLLGYATKSPRTAKFFYRVGSAVLHGALHGFDQRLAYSNQSPPRAQLAEVDAAAVLRDCTFAIQVYVAYIGALMYQTQWPDRGVLDAIEALEVIWQRIAAAPASQDGRQS